jgi:hypothetical protein
MGSLPSDGNTVTIGSLVYTFKDTINNSNPREVLIGATVADCIDYLEHCVNDDGTGEGTSYSSATTAHPDVTAAAVSGDDTKIAIAAQTVGISGNGIATTGTLSWTAGSTEYGGSGLTCPATPSGLAFKVYIFVTADTGKCWIEVVGVADAFGASSNFGYVKTSASKTFRMITHKYGFWIGIDGGADGDGNAFQCGTVRLYSTMEPNKITSATNEATKSVSAISNTTPVELTISSHGWSTGDKIYLENSDVPALDGYWTATVVDPDTVSLDGSTASGAGSSGDAGRQIQITFESDHEMTTGESVWITGAAGNTAINGAHTVTVIGAATAWLDNSKPNGDYAPDPGDEALAANPTQVSECYWMNHCQFSLTGEDCSFRGRFNTYGTSATQGKFQQRINQHLVSRSGGSNHPGHALIATRDVSYHYANDVSIIYRPLLSLDQSDLGSSHEWVGELWDCVLVNRNHTQDLKTSFEGYNWQQWSTHVDGYNNSLFLCYGET